MYVLPDGHGNLIITEDGVTSLVLLVIFRVRWVASDDILKYECLIFQRIFYIFHTNSNALVQMLPRNSLCCVILLMTILVMCRLKKKKKA